MEDGGGLVYEKKIEPYLQPGVVEQQPLHTLLEIQDRAIHKHLQVFLKENYISDICQKLIPYLKYLSDQRLTPKLEGRYIFILYPIV